MSSSLHHRNMMRRKEESERQAGMVGLFVNLRSHAEGQGLTLPEYDQIGPGWVLWHTKTRDGFVQLYQGTNGRLSLAIRYGTNGGNIGTTDYDWMDWLARDIVRAIEDPMHTVCALGRDYDPSTFRQVLAKQFRQRRRGAVLLDDTEDAARWASELEAIGASVEKED